MIIVTGGAGFIGSATVAGLNALGHNEIWIVDELGSSEKWKNLRSKRFEHFINKDEFFEILVNDALPDEVEAVVHLGACTSTTERDADYMMYTNYEFTKTLAIWALERDIRFIYASSAATYGDGSLGFSDDDTLMPNLRPLNIYGYSKHAFDLWVLQNELQGSVAGLKFFNVYGPNEHHKENMRSMVCRAFEQIQSNGRIKLFRSLNPQYADGEQLRDFIYVKDCVRVILWLLKNPDANGIFNLGTGKARTWKDLAAAVFSALGKELQIEYIDLPDELRDRYQYFTQATLEKLSAVGAPTDFSSLEDGVRDYVQQYLLKDALL